MTLKALLYVEWAAFLKILRLNSATLCKLKLPGMHFGDLKNQRKAKVTKAKVTIFSAGFQHPKSL